MTHEYILTYIMIHHTGAVVDVLFNSGNARRVSAVVIKYLRLQDKNHLIDKLQICETNNELIKAIASTNIESKLNQFLLYNSPLVFDDTSCIHIVRYPLVIFKSIT